MTFYQAMKQYNRQTYEGKRNAYLMLGHVIHLLQDVAQPDHGRLVPHPTSSKNEKEAYDEFMYCHLVAAEAAANACLACTVFCLPCAAGAFGIAEAACYKSIDTNEVGYERLVGDLWSLKDIDPRIVNDGVLTPIDYNYNAFFHEMSNFAITQADERGLESALGCGSFPIIEIPGINPNIQSDDPEARRPFMELTNEIVSKLIGYSAGLIQYFYEIVNHVPYVQRVAVIKGVAGRNPVGFAKFTPDPFEGGCSNVCLCYDAEWEKIGDSTCEKKIRANKLLSPSHQAYVFIQFGPNLPPPFSQPGSDMKSKKVRECSLTLTGLGPNLDVSLEAGNDPEISTFYWGSFQPVNPGQQPYQLKLEICAKDASAHLNSRLPHTGDELDANPQTIAIVDVDSPPHFPLIGYDPGPDKNHIIEIGLPMLADSFEPNDTFINSTIINLGLSETIVNLEENPQAWSNRNLTLHHEGDVDFFHLHFMVGEHDAGAIGGWKNDFGSGLYVEAYPPVLEIMLQEEYGACLTAELYRSNNTLHRNFIPAGNIQIESPLIVFDDQKLYLVIKSLDFVLQGPLRYALSVRYRPTYMTIKGRLLYRFLELSRHPTPPERVEGDPREMICYFDLPRMISDLEAFFPSYSDHLALREPAQRNSAEAGIRADLGRIAQLSGLFHEAERLLVTSAEGFRQLELQAQEAAVLENLKEVYRTLDKVQEMGRIKERLIQIGQR